MYEFMPDDIAVLSDMLAKEYCKFVKIKYVDDITEYGRISAYSVTPIFKYINGVTVNDMVVPADQLIPITDADGKEYILLKLQNSVMQQTQAT